MGAFCRKQPNQMSVFLTHLPPGLGADTHHQLHCAGLPAPLLGHRFRGRLADATGHGAAGDWPHTARRGHPLLVRQRHRHVGGLPVHRQVPGRGAHRGLRRRGRHREPDERRAVQAVDREAETACEADGAPGERTCEHAAELHDCGLHQACALLTLTQEDGFNHTCTHILIYLVHAHSFLKDRQRLTQLACLSRHWRPNPPLNMPHCWSDSIKTFLVQLKNQNLKINFIAVTVTLMSGCLLSRLLTFIYRSQLAKNLRFYLLHLRFIMEDVCTHQS